MQQLIYDYLIRIARDMRRYGAKYVMRKYYFDSRKEFKRVINSETYKEVYRKMTYGR